MTVKLRKIALFGEGIVSKSPVVTRQRRLNCYLEVRKDQDKSSIVCYGTPGMNRAFTAPTPLNNPVRGILGNDTALYVVAGNQIQSLSKTGILLGSGLIATSTGIAGMALNPTQLLVVDGNLGYVYTPSSGLTVPAGGAFPNGARTCVYCNGFFLAELPGTNQWFVSALNDGTNWPGLSFAAAVQQIDGIMAVDALTGLAVIFSGGHVEFWQNLGLSPEPFQYIQNSASPYGLVAVFGRCHVGDSILYLAQNTGGGGQNSAGGFQIVRIRGYSVTVVSTPDVDSILQSMARAGPITDCTAYGFHNEGHDFAQFNFPTANRSLLYDATTDLWGEVQSGITSAYAARHIGNLSTSAFKTQWIADYSNGNIYNPDPTVYTDNGNVIVREVVSRCALENFNTFRISQIYLDMQTGVGLSNPALQGYNPMVELSIARDNRDFGVARMFPLGLQGQYMTRVNSRRWGRARQANLRIRMTDPVPFVITSGAIMTKSRAGTAAPQARAAA